MRPFEMKVTDAALADLRERLARTRFEEDGHEWEAGTSPAYLRELVEHWRTAYDWRAREAHINHLAQFVATLDGKKVHFVHARGKGPAPLPLVLTHGYPDSFLRFAKLLPLLTDPEDPADAFDVVVPSLPGYAFSDGGTSLFEVAGVWHKLMTDVLGYQRYGAHGGDFGAIVTEHLARHTSALVGVHLTDVPFFHTFQKPRDLTPAEKQYLEKTQAYQMDEGAYAMIQGTRPDTLADGLNDSPAGLAAWLVEKYRSWSDCGGDVERRFTKDDLLDTVMLYWATGSIGSAFGPYYDVMHAGLGRWILEKGKDLLAHARVPAGFALFPRDLSHPPRSWAERFFDVQRWTELPRGGHFAAFEEPELLAEELRSFFRPLRQR